MMKGILKILKSLLLKKVLKILSLFFTMSRLQNLNG